MKKALHVAAVIAAIAPAIYLLIIFPSLPGTVPTHFGLEGKPDDWGSKNELWVMTGVMSGVSLLCYLLLCNVHKIDPKRNAAANKDRLQKIAFATVLFISAIQLWIVLSTQNGNTGKMPRFIFVGIGVLFAVIGNYMANIKPNYFAGIRLPWTLENEDNWRKTHQYASKLWFGGGILIAICSLVLPIVASMVILFTVVLVMTIIPMVYSYRLYKLQKQS